MTNLLTLHSQSGYHSAFTQMRYVHKKVSTENVIQSEWKTRKNYLITIYTFHFSFKKQCVLLGSKNKTNQIYPIDPGYKTRDIIIKKRKLKRQS